MKYREQMCTGCFSSVCLNVLQAKPAKNRNGSCIVIPATAGRQIPCTGRILKKGKPAGSVVRILSPLLTIVPALRIPKHIDIAVLFCRKETRLVAKDGTFRINKVLYETREHLIGKKITVQYDRDDPAQTAKSSRDPSTSIAPPQSTLPEMPGQKENHYNQKQILIRRKYICLEQPLTSQQYHFRKISISKTSFSMSSLIPWSNVLDSSLAIEASACLPVTSAVENLPLSEPL
ncbi:hypothetical protein DRN98_07195 [Methanosarcinales archaeon]|nr:MAG: hypothetical protein DRN98_07195 [Methanosarcinales archaeon]